MNLLGIYLNDHLAAATGGAERARHMALSSAGTELAAALEPIAAELVEDRAALLAVMRRLDVPVRPYKVVAGRLAERLGRLKTNGRIVRRSPLTSLVELEALRLDAEARATVWQTLRDLADRDDRLDPDQLDHLLERTRRRQGALEELRRRRIGPALTPA